MSGNTYCVKEFLTDSPEPSTSSVVSFHGDIKWEKDCTGGLVSFLEISSCHERARLHRTFEMPSIEWVKQVRKLRDHINNFLEFLENEEQIISKNSEIIDDVRNSEISEERLKEIYCQIDQELVNTSLTYTPETLCINTMKKALKEYQDNIIDNIINDK